MNPEKFLSRTPKRPEKGPKKSDGTKALSERQEHRVARRLKGRVQPGSGAGRTAVRPGGLQCIKSGGGKGDVPTDLLLIECKTTENASISLKQEHLIKISGEAKLQMKSPAMVLSFPVMPDEVDEDWIVMPLGVWEKVSGQLRERAAARRVLPLQADQAP